MKRAYPETLLDYLRKLKNTKQYYERAREVWRRAEEIHARQTGKGGNRNGGEHCRKVEENIWRFLVGSDKVKELKAADYFLLSCAACCHDFDKGLNHFEPDEVEHGEGSGRFVIENHEDLRLDYSEACAVAPRQTSAATSRPPPCPKATDPAAPRPQCTECDAELCHSRIAVPIFTGILKHPQKCDGTCRFCTPKRQHNWPWALPRYRASPAA